MDEQTTMSPPGTLGQAVAEAQREMPEDGIPEPDHDEFTCCLEKSDLAESAREVAHAANTAVSQLGDVVGRLFEMVYCYTSVQHVASELLLALKSSGSTNFQGLWQHADKVMAQAQMIFGNSMLPEYGPGGKFAMPGPPKAQECDLCRGMGIPDIDEHGKKVTRPCPQCGANPTIRIVADDTVRPTPEDCQAMADELTKG